MNAFDWVNRCIGLAFLAGLAAFGAYYGLEQYKTARKELHNEFRKELTRQIERSMDSLPPGLDGTYPADGPLADMYRNSRSLEIPLGQPVVTPIPSFPTQSSRAAKAR
jgi:hypothetical protein